VIYEYSSFDNVKREIRIHKRLNHPNVIKLWHYFEDKTHIYLVLEYAVGGNLVELIRKRWKLPENDAFNYFFQTCLGMDYLHKNSIIHRDLKVRKIVHHH
jgi:serine/threonine protein kinase